MEKKSTMLNAFCKCAKSGVFCGCSRDRYSNKKDDNVSLASSYHSASSTMSRFDSSPNWPTGSYKDTSKNQDKYATSQNPYKSLSNQVKDMKYGSTSQNSYMTSKSHFSQAGSSDKYAASTSSSSYKNDSKKK